VKSPNVAFGKLVAGLRRASQLSQEELAERAALHRTYVSQVERGLKSPTIITLLRLSKALDTTPSKLIRQLEAELGGF
jgi:transcriptional regulator with XRE-family HTH domain